MRSWQARADGRYLLHKGRGPAAKGRHLVREEPTRAGLYRDIQSFLHEFVQICHETLREAFLGLNNQCPVTYLRSRGLDDRALIEEFSVGYVDELMPQSESVQRIRDLERRKASLVPYLTKHSAARQSMGSAARAKIPCVYGPGGNILFHRRLVFPVFDATGSIVNLYGRSIDHANTFRHVYGASRWSWYNIGRAPLRSARSIVITESIIDALTFVCCGIPAVTSLCSGSYGYGPNARHGGRLGLVRARLADEIATVIPARIIYIFFDKDADATGDVAAVTMAKILAEVGFEVRPLHLPAGEDPNSLYVKAGASRAERRARFLEHFTEMMANATDFVMHEAYLELERLGLTVEQLTKAKAIVRAVWSYYNSEDEHLFDAGRPRRLRSSNLPGK